MKSVIIADDDLGIQEVVELILKRAGYATTVLNNGTPLLNNQFTEPDIFLIDKQLQDTDGLDICRHLKSRENLSDTPVIIFSASGRVHELAKAAGANDFLEKPFQIKTLLEMIERYTT